MLAQTLARPSKLVWNPLNQQYREADTTFLLDPDSDSAAGLAINNGNTIQGALLYARDSSAPNIVSGRFRKGIQPASASSGHVWCPIGGVLGVSEFTIEFWLSISADWTTTSGSLALGENNSNNSVQFTVGSSRISCKISHRQISSAVGANPYTLTAQSSIFTSGTYPANTWVCVAATLKSGTLTLYAGKQGDSQVTQLAQATGAVSPIVWSDSGKADGLMIPADVATQTATVGWTVSDLRVSRFARTPGTAISTPSDLTTITVSTSVSGAAKQQLHGVAKPVASTSNPKVPQAAAAATVKAQGGLATVRVDAYQSVTPTVAGTTDATHPNAGHSGSFSFDWQAMDRELQWVSETMGCEPYISLDTNLALFGGSNANLPWTNAQFTASGNQTPDTNGGILTLTAAPGTQNQKEFTAAVVGGGTNRYAFTNTSGSTCTGCTLISGTAGATIATGTTVNIGYLTGKYAYNAPGNNPQPPNNTTGFATVSADMLYHVLNENNVITGAALTNKPKYIGLWNEPDQASEWETTSTKVTDMLRLYGAVAPALKAVSASIKVGGVDSADWASLRTVWLEPLIWYCGTLAQPAGLSATAQATGGSAPGAVTRFYKIVGYNGAGNSIASAEVSATPVSGGSTNLSWSQLAGADSYKIFAATSSGGQTGATSLLVSVDGSVTSYTDTWAALQAGSIPSAAVANTAPLDFISFHFYSGDLCDLVHASLRVQSVAGSAGIATPAIINGEWQWCQFNTNNAPGAGHYPWCQPGISNGLNIPPTTQPYTVDFAQNDWDAAFHAASLITMQNAPGAQYVRAVHNSGTTNSLFDSSSNPQAIYNVHRLWGMLGATILQTNTPVSPHPGVFWVASKDVGGKVYVLIANLNYRKIKPNYPISVDVSAFALADGTSVTAYAVDDQTSNAYDTGGASTTLQTVSVPTLKAGKTSIRLRPRAAALLVIG